ncbi:hypothetical protein FPQ10_06685 [Allobacillus sp. SKP2-8]|uniref:PilN domain-containing protein n=1 Tax=unclassified Allobacillus TaxID=2628859 RepID=UPI001182A56B|nr:hypothetical protein [Allobacillus sp. SKP2-8]TSJ66938.1 hypothetical protein FPQ10_06685 [Allobacillus sp. SKP2-8]
MAIEINLLRKKEPKNQGSFLVGALLTITTILAIAICFLLAWQQGNEMSLIDSRLQQQEKFNQALIEQVEGPLNDSELQERKGYVEQLRPLHPKISSALQKVSNQLPSSATIEQLTYNENIVEVSVNVRSSHQATQYLNQLRELQGVDDVLLHSILAIPEDNQYSAVYTLQIEAGESS